MGDAIGSKNTCKTFSTEFFYWRIQSKKSSFSIGSASRNSQSKKVESKKPFFDCVRKPDLGFSRKRPFPTDKSDCMRNGLRTSAVSWSGQVQRDVFSRWSITQRCNISNAQHRLLNFPWCLYSGYLPKLCL